MMLLCRTKSGRGYVVALILSVALSLAGCTQQQDEASEGAAQDTPTPSAAAVVVESTTHGAGTGRPASPTVTPAEPIMPIGAVQGTVDDQDSGDQHVTPLDGQTVTVQGVVFARTYRQGRSGALRGFFMQNTAATADGDPQSSDGIYVFMRGYETLKGADHVPRVGDELVVRGRVGEYYEQTQLTSCELVRVVRGNVDLDAELPAVELDPPDDLDASRRYFERLEAMRVRLPAGALVISGRSVYGAADGELWVIRGDHPVAMREAPYTRRAFRDTHPLDNRPEVAFDDGNGYRIMIGSQAMRDAQNPETMVPPVRAFDTVLTTLTGGLYYGYGKYGLMADAPFEALAGPDPAENGAPVEPDRTAHYTVAIYNVENLYDFRNDPFDPCDFAGDPGAGVIEPPFNYVPESDAEYRARLRRLARQIVRDLHAPDILLIQEAEDQDICTPGPNALMAGELDDADGMPDTLQELALAIVAEGGPQYVADLDRDGADTRGIICAYMYRADRVEMPDPTQAHPVLGFDPQHTYPGDPVACNTDVSNPKALNAVMEPGAEGDDENTSSVVFSRAVQVGHFRVWREGLGRGESAELYILNNHFSSRPRDRVASRIEQARLNAALAAALLRMEPTPHVIVGGDLNVYPRPDDPFRPGESRHPSDQLGAIYEAGLLNLYEVMLERSPASAYSYVYEGHAQTLDQLFVSPGLHERLVDVRAAHINADWPDRGPLMDAPQPRRASDHDPVVATFAFR